MTPVLIVGDVQPCNHQWSTNGLSLEQLVKLGGPPLFGVCTEIAGHQSPHALLIHDVAGAAPVTRVYKWIEVRVEGRTFVCGGWSRQVPTSTVSQS